MKRTKLSKAIDLYIKCQHMEYNMLVGIFRRSLKLPSANAARTYVSMAKKELAGSLDIEYNTRKVDPRKTKKGRAMALFIKNPDLSRAEMIQLFVDELDMSKNSAATHCSSCSQEYVGKKHNAIV